MEITDDMVKAKHKEFNDRVGAAISKKGGNNMGAQFSPAIQRLRQLAQLRRPTLERPYGS